MSNNKRYLADLNSFNSKVFLISVSLFSSVDFQPIERSLKVVRATVENVIDNPTKNCVLHRCKHEPDVVGVRSDSDVGVDGGPGRKMGSGIADT